VHRPTGGEDIKDIKSSTAIAEMTVSLIQLAHRFVWGGTYLLLHSAGNFPPPTYGASLIFLLEFLASF